MPDLKNINPVFLGPADLALRWGFSLDTIKTLWKRGLLPEAARLPTRLLRWHIEVVERYEADRREGRLPGERPGVQLARESRQARREE